MQCEQSPIEHGAHSQLHDFIYLIISCLTKYTNKKLDVVFNLIIALVSNLTINLGEFLFVNYNLII